MRQFSFFHQRNVAISRTSTIEEVQKTRLSQKAFKGLWRILQAPITIESNTRHYGKTTDTLPISLGQTSIVEFLTIFLSKIPENYAPMLYIHGSFGNEKTLAKFERGTLPLFNDFDLMLCINSADYTLAEPVITQAIGESMAQITGLTPALALSRGLQKKTFLSLPANPYMPYGALFNFGPRNGSNMVEIEVLALGHDPVGNRSPTLATLCSSSLDSLMIGPLTPMIEEIALHKKDQALQRALGQKGPQTFSKYFYTEADFQIIETLNLVISRPEAAAISFPRLTKQSMHPSGIRIASPWVIETMAKSIQTLSPEDFETTLKRYLQVHFPESGGKEKKVYLQKLTHLLTAMTQTHSAKSCTEAIAALCAIVAKQGKLSRNAETTPFLFDPPNLMASWAHTFVFISRDAPSGNIMGEALVGMTAYLNLIESTDSTADISRHIPAKTDTLSLQAIEYRMLTHLKDHPVLFQRIIPSLAKIATSMFSPTLSEPFLAPPDPQVWKEWVQSVDDPIVIPFYIQLMRLDTAPELEKWNSLCTRLNRIGHIPAADTWLFAGLALIVDNTSAWQPVVNAFKAGASPEKALTWHAPVLTLEQARQIRHLCPSEQYMWVQRLLADPLIPLTVKTVEAEHALTQVAQTPSTPFTWQILQMTLQLFAHVPALPEPVIQNLANRIERKCTGHKPQQLQFNPLHLEKISGHEILCAKLFNKVCETKTLSEDILSPLATTVIHAIAAKKIPLGLVKTALKQHMEQSPLWAPSMATLSAIQYCQHLQIAMNCGVRTDTLVTVLHNVSELSQIAQMPQKEGLDVLFKGLQTLQKELKSPSLSTDIFLTIVSHLAPAFTHNPAMAAAVFSLLELPPAIPHQYATFNKLCRIAMALGQLSAPPDTYTPDLVAPTDTAAKLGHWYATVRPMAAEQNQIYIKEIDLEHKTESTKSVSVAMLTIFHEMVQQHQYLFVIQALEYSITIPHPLYVSEILLRTEALNPIPMATKQTYLAEFNHIQNRLKDAWKTCVVPFLYQFCLSGQMPTGYYAYTDIKGYRRKLPVNVTLTLEKMNRGMIIPVREWMHLNLEMADTLMAQITEDRLTGMIRDQLLSMVSAMIYNGTLTRIASHKTGEFKTITTPPHDSIPTIEKLIGMMAMQLEAPIHYSCLGNLFADILRYLQAVADKTAVNLMIQFLQTHQTLIRHPDVQAQIAESLGKDQTQIEAFNDFVAGYKTA